MSYAAVTWFEGVDKALISEIKDSVRVLDKKGDKVSLPDSNIIIRKPEEDYKIEVYPSVSIYNLSARHSTIRYNQYSMSNKEYEHSMPRMKFQKGNIPFDLTYQLDFWARYQIDMNNMLQSWLVNHFRQFNLPIEEDEGYTCNALMEGSIIKSDILDNNARIFHSIMTYVIWVEIEDETVYNVPIVEGVALNVKGDRICTL